MADSTEKKTKSNEALARSIKRIGTESKTAASFLKILSSALTDANASDFNKKMEKSSKGLLVLSEALTSSQKKAESVSKAYKDLGMYMGKSVRKSIDTIADANKQISSLVKKSEQLHEVANSFSAFDKSLKSVTDKIANLNLTPTFEDAEETVKNLNKTVEDLKDGISSSDFKQLKESLEKLDSKDLEKFPFALNEVHNKLSQIKSSKALKILKNGGEDAKKKFESLDSALNKMIASAETFSSAKEEMEKISAVKDSLLGIIETVPDLSDESKKAIENLARLMNDPLKNAEEIKRKYSEIDFSEAIAKGFEATSKQIGDLANQVKSEESNLEKARANLERPHSLTLDLSTAAANIEDLVSDLQSKKIKLETVGVLSPGADKQISRLRDLQNELTQNQASYNIALQQAENITDKTVAKAGEQPTFYQQALEKVTKLEQKLRGTAAALQEAKVAALTISDASEKAISAGWGSGKAKELSDKIVLASKNWQIFASKIPGVGGVLSKLGPIVEQIGLKVGKLAIPLALIQGAISLAKWTMEIDAKAKRLNKSLADTGIFATTSGKDMASSLSAASWEVKNLNGLYMANKGGDAFVMTQERIEGVLGALTQSGVSANALRKDLKNVSTTAAATGKDLLKAADLSATFSKAFNVAESDIAKMMGDLKFSLGSTLGETAEDLTAIATAAQRSSMSTNKFLGVLQTATSGLILYQSQLAGTAAVMADLSKSGNLTGAGVERTARTIGEFMQNTDSVLKAFAASPKAATNALSAVSEELSNLKNKKQKNPEDEKNIKFLTKLEGYFKSGQLEQAAAMMQGAPAEAQKLVAGSLLKTIEAVTDGTPFAMQKALKTFDMESLYPDWLRSNGGLTEDLTKKGSKKLSSDEIAKKQKDLTKAAVSLDQQTYSAINALKEAVENSLITEVGKHTLLLEAISAAVGTLGTALTAIGLFSGGSMFSSILGTLGIGGAAGAGTLGTITAGGLAGAALPGAILGGLAGYGAVKGLDYVTDGGYSRWMGSGGSWLYEQMNGGQEAKDMAAAEEKVKKRIEEMKKAGTYGGQKTPVTPIPPSPNKNTPTMPTTSTSSSNDASSTNNQKNASVTININGGDTEKITKIVRYEVNKAVGKTN